MEKSNVVFSFDIWNDQLRPESEIELWKKTDMMPSVIYYEPQKVALEDLIAYLDKCEQAGVKVTYLDGRTDFRNMQEGREEEFLKDIETVARDILWHPAIERIQIGDEPHGEYHYKAFIMVAKKLKEVTDKKVGSCFYHWGRGKDFTDYFGVHPSEYHKVVEKMIVEGQLDYFMFDDYSYMSEYFGEDRENIFFKNMSLFSELSKKLKIPAYNCAITTAFQHYLQPTETDHRWLISTTFAYGMKGVQFYTFYDLPQKGGFSSITPGLGTGFPIDGNGNTTYAYDDIMRAVGEFKTRFAGEFEKLEYIESWHYITARGGAKMLFDGDDLFKYFHADHGVSCIVSKFYNKEEDAYAYAIVNLSRTKSEVYIYNFKEPYEEYDNHVWLLPGQMALVKLYGKAKKKKAAITGEV